MFFYYKPIRHFTISKRNLTAAIEKHRMEIEKKFITKTGFCHVLPDKIVLTRDGIIGNLTDLTVGNTITRILLIYGGLACVFVYGAYDFYLKGQIPAAIFFAFITIYLIYGILTSLNNSATPVIDRNKIKEVRLKKAIPGLTRSRFEIKFEDDKGKIKKRLILLPGSLAEGQAETERAIEIMKEEKLIINR
jgi:hypothetical protein